MFGQVIIRDLREILPSTVTRSFPPPISHTTKTGWSVPEDNKKYFRNLSIFLKALFKYFSSTCPAPED